MSRHAKAAFATSRRKRSVRQANNIAPGYLYGFRSRPRWRRISGMYGAAPEDVAQICDRIEAIRRAPGLQAKLREYRLAFYGRSHYINRINSPV